VSYVTGAATQSHAKKIKNPVASDRVLRTQRLYRFAMKKLETLYIYAHHRDIPRAELDSIDWGKPPRFTLRG